MQIEDSNGGIGLFVSPVMSAKVLSITAPSLKSSKTKVLVNGLMHTHIIAESDSDHYPAWAQLVQLMPAGGIQTRG